MLFGLQLAWAAQAPLHGRVTDTLGRPVSGAVVQLVDPTGKVVAQTLTGENGSYELAVEGAALRCVVQVSKAGFSADQEAVDLNYPVTRAFDFALGSDDDLVIDVHERRVAEHITGPGVSPEGALDYSVGQDELEKRPLGTNARLNDILLQMPGVALDQNQQVHLRDQHNNGQYQINGIMLPLDMYAEPAFISFLNPQMIKKIDLYTGVLPAQFGFTNSGGVISIDTKTGKDNPGGVFQTYFGQRGVVQPSLQVADHSGNFDYYISALYGTGNNAFSQANPQPDPIHNYTHNGQGFGLFSYDIEDDLKLSLITSLTSSANQLPNVPNLPANYQLAGASAPGSANLDSKINFEDRLAILALNGTPSDDLKWRLAYSTHTLSQDYRPDDRGELIYQGVSARTVTHNDDQSLQGGATWVTGDHTLNAGFYYGRYNLGSTSSTLVFPVDADGKQTSAFPRRIPNGFSASDLVQGYYLNDLWKLSPRFALNVGLRLDSISGFTNATQLDPTINLIYKASDTTTLHAGFAHYLDTPAFQGFSSRAQTSFQGTTNAGPPGVVNPFAQQDDVWDIGVTHQFNPHLSLSLDGYYEHNRFYGDEGQFGVVPIFVNLNYDHGTTWGTELALKYQNGTAQEAWNAYMNLTIGESYQYGVTSGQFNFTPDELAYITKNGFVLDHQPLYGISSGVTYTTDPWTFSMQFLYSSGLVTGIQQSVTLPTVIQTDLGISRAFDIGGTRVTNKLALLNIFDRVNLIRPADGIGVYQAAYAPRFSVFDSFVIPFDLP